jgi:hypothetical protein
MERLTVKSTGYSSDLYGDCEVCGSHCSEVFTGLKERSYHWIDGSERWRYVSLKFGHKDCLSDRLEQADITTVWAHSRV